MIAASAGERDTSGLRELADELLQAQLDTLQLLQREDPLSGAWPAHADYLRALTRAGQAILAAS